MKMLVKGVFHGAHHLTLGYDSPCVRLHGHTWKVEVEVTGTKLTNGMLVDFSKVKDVFRKYDHQNLNTFFEQPTAENIASKIREDVYALSDKIDNVVVRLWETENNMIEV